MLKQFTVVILCLMFGWAALSLRLPAAAQQASPTPSVVATVVATPLPTPDPAALAGVQEPRDWLNNALQYGTWGVLGLALVGLAMWLLRAYGAGLQKSVTDMGEEHARKLRSQLAKPETMRRQNSRMQAYYDWLQEELKHLPIIPIRSTERQEQLLLEDVYLPLRVVERTQIEGFRKLVGGDFDPEGEYQLRREAFDALEGSRGVYRLLSDVQMLPKPTAARQARQQRMRAESEQEMTSRCLLLIGDAGSGKTTTLQYGALVLSHDCRQANTQAARDFLDLHLSQPITPFYIRLTLLASYIRKAEQRMAPEELPGLQDAPSKLLLDWLDSYIAAQMQKHGSQLQAHLPSQQIATGKCLIMLDGLDETGDARERNYIQRLIHNLVQDYPTHRYLVASRPFEELGLAGFDERHLSPLNRDEIEQLLKNWFAAVRKSATRRQHESVDSQVAYLRGILDQNARLFEMATNPLLLTSMALLVHTGVGLPRERAELYNRLIGLLIDTWRTQQITGGIPGQDERRTRYGGEESPSGVQRRLQEVAAWMQEQGRREISLREAQQILRPVYKKNNQWEHERADDYVMTMFESLALESGLIQRRDGGYSFAHYTLQEYLTARAYDLRDDGIDALYQHWTKPRWKETILLAVGHWATGSDPDKARQFLEKLVNTQSSPPADSRALLAQLMGMSLSDERINASLLAAQALDDADADRVLELGPLRTKVIGQLQSWAFDPQTVPDAILRNRAANLLDRLGGDLQRKGLDLTSADYWAARIEPGIFSMGDNNGKYDDEKPQFDYTIRQAYALARFPVTNRQYQLFMDALAGKGSPEALAAAHKLQILMQQYQQTAEQFQPRYWPGTGYPAGEGNHPVDGVNWYAATAFAWWVDAWLHNLGILKAHEAIRLPTEAEWERAAAYPVLLPSGNSRAGRREYPWGSWPDLTNPSKSSISARIPTNIDESRIGDTSVVGIFPHGAADCGAEELAGNVWEWCSTSPVPYPWNTEIGAESLYTKHKSSSSTYVLRGGSWRNNRDSARCACRLDYLPGLDYDNLGFRLAHLFSSSSF